MPKLTRRQFLTSAGTALALGAVPTAAAQSPPDRPDHITSVTDDPEVIGQYSPNYVASVRVRQQMLGTYGWKAESSKYDTDAYYYWTRYSSQQSLLERLSPFSGGKDAHFRDHEPCIVFVNPDGSVDRVVCTGYHHLALEVSGEDAPLRADRHITLDVIDPWHHYRTYEATRAGVLAQDLSLAEFGGWLGKREQWYENGAYDASHTPAIEDPWVMLERDAWWADDETDYQLAKVWRWLGLRGADQTDDLRIED